MYGCGILRIVVINLDKSVESDVAANTSRYKVVTLGSTSITLGSATTSTADIKNKVYYEESRSAGGGPTGSSESHGARISADGTARQYVINNGKFSYVSGSGSSSDQACLVYTV